MNPTIFDRYQRACQTPSDINEHLPTLYALGLECRRITEFGTNLGNSTTAFLAAQPDSLICYDYIQQPAVIEELASLAGRTKFVFHLADVRTVSIDVTELLFIDTLHTAKQLSCELTLHAGKVGRFIVLHDTTTFGLRGECPGEEGLLPALEAFLRQGSFERKQVFTNNNGLTILERKRPELSK